MNGTEENGQPKTPWLEWAASGLGLVLAIGIIGYLVWNGVTGDGSPPSVQVQVEDVVEGGAGYTVVIRAVNASGSTAKTVLVEGELARDGQTVETSETTFDYIAGHSEAKGGLYFSRDPREFELKIGPKGYSRP